MQLYLPIWVSVARESVHFGIPVPPNKRDPAAAVAVLVELAHMGEGGGFLPERVEVADEETAEALGFLRDAGVELCVVERLHAVDRMLDEMANHFNELCSEIVAPPLPGPLDGQGVTVKRMQRFAQAAAAFYRAAPWQYLDDADVIEIEQPHAPAGMRCTTVMGAGGISFGLGFYRSMDEYARLRRAARYDKPDVSGLWHVHFGPATEFPECDLHLWEDHGLALASDRAYPYAIQGGTRGEFRRASADELAFLEGLLWALSHTTEAEIDSGRWHKQVATHDGAMRFTLALPALLDPPSHEEWMNWGFEPDRRAHEQLHSDIDRYFRQHPPADEKEVERTLSRLFMNKRFDELVTQPETPLERAQDFCFQAFDTHGRRRVQLARRALEICADCADAYVILAERVTTEQGRLDHYANGVAAGERALGADALRKDAGHFWGIGSTRPYMRARFGLAQSLEQLGRFDEAVDHYRELLRLNPNDNQGVRYLLLPLLLRLGRDADAARMLKESNEQSAIWAYARALLALRQGAKPALARRELREAMNVNAYVPQYLLKESDSPSPSRYSPGNWDEAVITAKALRPAFAQTTGALDWVQSELAQFQREATRRRREQRKKERQRKQSQKKRRKAR
jgi:tetratricopeptide (TPR) repeat protein